MNNLAEKRTDQLMTQEELGKKAGISKTTISIIENEHHEPQTITKKKIAKALGCPVEEIFPEDEK